MSSKLAQRFTDVLLTMERERDLQKMTDLFAKDAVLRRIPRSGGYEGERAIHQFWEEYLDAFSSVATEFTHVIDNGDTVVLEWRSTGQTKHGKNVSYEGCTVLELAEEQIRAFRTYYDAASSGMGAAALPDEEEERVGPATAAMVKTVQEAG